MEKNAPELFFGKRGESWSFSKTVKFIEGIFTVMDYIAERAGEEEAFLDLFTYNSSHS